MIKVVRSACPAVLLKKTAGNDRFSHKKVVDALYAMQHRKCCYCESRVSVEGHGKAVEHFRPKAVFKGRRNDWNNLLLVCAQCNGKKSDQFPVEVLTSNPKEVKVVYVTRPSSMTPLVVDPSDPLLDPEDHLDFIVDDSNPAMGLIFSRRQHTIRARRGLGNISRRGKETIAVLGLDRTFYTDKHKTRLLQLGKDYLTLLTAIHQKEDAEAARLKAEFRLALSARCEFTAVARAFARDKQLDRNLGIPIPTGAD